MMIDGDSRALDEASPEEGRGDASDHPWLDVLRNAITRRTCVSTVYNKSTVTLAPHILYSRHGDLFVDAVVVERDGKKPREVKLGTYKLAGLGAVTATKRLFAALPAFDPGDPKYVDSALSVRAKAV